MCEIADFVNEPAGSRHTECNCEVGKYLEKPTSANIFVELVDPILYSALELAIVRIVALTDKIPR